MDFMFDVSQIPVIPITETRYPLRTTITNDNESSGNIRASLNDFGQNGWKRPQQSQVHFQLFIFLKKILKHID